MPNRLVIFLDELYEKDGHSIYGQFNWLLYAAEIAKHFEAATLFLPLKPRPPEKLSSSSAPYLLDLKSTNLEIVGLPPYTSIASSLLWLPSLIRQFYHHRQTISRAKAILIRVPSLIGLMLGEWARLLGATNLSFYVAGNIETTADPILEGGLKGKFFSLLAKLVNRLTALTARNSLVISVSPEIAAKFTSISPLFPKPRKILILPIPMHSQADLYERPTVGKSNDLKLLRVCRLYPCKGIETLLSSMALLVQRGLHVTLEIVGGGEPDYQRQLKKMIKDLHLDDHVKYSGHKSHREVMQAFRRADIHVISSLAEGTPRVIWEGWASSLPLVATAMGGIPELVQHEKHGLLVPPGDPVALADAIDRLYHDPQLRHKLAVHGLALARKYTREKQAALIAESINDFTS